MESSKKKKKTWVINERIKGHTRTRAIDAGSPETLLLDDEAGAYEGAWNHRQYEPFQIARVHFIYRR